MDRVTTRIMKMLPVMFAVLLLGLLVWVISEQMQDTRMDVTYLTEHGVKGETEAFLEVVTTMAETEDVQISEGDGEADPIRLLFAGDVLLSDHVIRAYDKAGNIQGVLDQNLLDRISGADLFMVNQEFPFSDRGTAAQDKQYTFRLAPSRVGMMNEMGVDIVTLANNHALDFGRDALLDTGTILDDAGIRYVGAGENLDRAKKPEMMELGDKTWGFLAASRVIPEGSWNAGSTVPGMLTTYDPEILLGEIRKAKEVCDVVVVYVHWGIEREERPKDYQRVLAQQYIDVGADMVIGSHPHVLQGLEYYQGKPIVYSLGNFVFGSSIPKTMLLQADLSGEDTRLSLVPCTSSGGYTKEVTDPAKISEFYQYMESISYGVTIDEDGVVMPDKAQP